LRCRFRSPCCWARGAPPPPQPAPEHARPILEFWHAQDINSADRRRARDDGRDRLAREFLVAARFDPKDPSLYASKLRELIGWLQANEPFDRPHQDENADVCAAEHLVGRLSSTELAETRAFFATPSGKRFWAESRIGISLLPDCYQYLMRQSVNGVQALHGVGLKAPPEWEGPAFD
jgi:hypothetical protein